MKRPLLSLLGVVCLILLTSLFASIGSLAQTCTCFVPPRGGTVPRYPQDAGVTVYLSTPGFTAVELQAIEDGILAWNSQNNNSGVQFHIVRTANAPPAFPPGHAVTIVFNPQINPTGEAAAETETSHYWNAQGMVVLNAMTFYGNIRQGWSEAVPAFIRALASHETGHALGLDHANCSYTLSIMTESVHSSSVITNCDNVGINGHSNYPPSSCPSCPWADYSECPSNCVSAIDWCMYRSFGCPPVIGVMKDGACWCYRPSPVLIDVLGNGFDLTDAANGVDFDINGNGTLERISWTTVGGDDAWLAIDLNGNGVIDNGTEVFGTFSPQPAPPAGEEKNGFLALAEYDKLIAGGNMDGLITASDAAFSQLRLWQDLNHNGVSEASELHTLIEFGLATLELRYKESKKTDEHGNQLRYRAKVKDVHGRQIGRWAWDVFLLGQQ